MAAITRRQIETYARDLAGRMGLKDWSISVIDGEPPDGAAADVRCVTGRKVGEIRIGTSILERDRHEIRYYVTHELVHCHFGAMHNYLDSVVSEAIYKAYGHPYEYGVDGMAMALSQFLPLPPSRRS